MTTTQASMTATMPPAPGLLPRGYTALARVAPWYVLLFFFLFSFFLVFFSDILYLSMKLGANV